MYILVFVLIDFLRRFFILAFVFFGGFGKCFGLGLFVIIIESRGFLWVIFSMIITAFLCAFFMEFYILGVNGRFLVG